MPPPAAPAGWGPQPQDPDWAPPPPPPPRSPGAGQQGWGAAPPPQAPHPDWGGGQSAWGQAPAYGPSTPAPNRRKRLWIILGAVAAAVVVVLLVGVIGVWRLLAGNLVPPATGATVSTSFVQLKVTSSWSETQSRDSEVELTNKGDGDMLVGYGNAGQDGISSDQSAFSNLQANLLANTGGGVSQCLPSRGVTIGGKAGEEEGFRYNFQGTDLCEIAWVDYVSSSRYYFWNIVDDYSHLSTLRNEDAAMQETANWKV